jgi:2,4-dienoyl-CoA reductase-like NADH-dependent reductase (Old Yellow Enzyme family)
VNRAFQDKALGTTGIRLNNAFIKAATLEGMYEHGLPTRALTDHHVAMAKGGVALTTISYGAVSADGRTFPYQMYIHEESLIKLEELADEVHQAGGKVCMQLIHCGYFSKNKAIKNPLAPSRIFNAYGAMSGIVFSREMTREDMDKVSDDFARAALRLKEAGFDAVEILDAGFEFIAIARALIHDPEFLLKLKDGSIERSECTRCNQCVVEMDRDGVRCVL